MLWREKNGGKSFEANNTQTLHCTRVCVCVLSRYVCKIPDKGFWRSEVNVSFVLRLCALWQRHPGHLLPQIDRPQSAAVANTVCVLQASITFQSTFQTGGKIKFVFCLRLNVCQRRWHTSNRNALTIVKVRVVVTSSGSMIYFNPPRFFPTLMVNFPVQWLDTGSSPVCLAVCSNKREIPSVKMQKIKKRYI